MRHISLLAIILLQFIVMVLVYSDDNISVFIIILYVSFLGIFWREEIKQFTFLEQFNKSILYIHREMLSRIYDKNILIKFVSMNFWLTWAMSVSFCFIAFNIMENKFRLFVSLAGFLHVIGLTMIMCYDKKCNNKKPQK